MQRIKGELAEIWLEGGGTAGRITFAGDLHLAPGQYLAAYAPEDISAVLTQPLFLAGVVPDGILAAPPLPSTWQPGYALELRGPLGCGFNLPATAYHVGLAAFGASAARLLPLADLALAQGCEVTLFCDLPAASLSWRSLPAALEISPVKWVREALAWADYLALDIPIQRLKERNALVGVQPGERLLCAAEVLVEVSMPCSGAAACGACAVRVKRGWQLACEDGPVFPWERLE
jgi:NAD(P)H-flavin reductase